MRRLLSLALSIVMVLSLLPAGALAEEPVLDEPVQEPKTETCTHGNDPAVCEACASEARVAAVQAQIDALPRDVTAETKEAAQSALSAVDTAKSVLTESEQAQLDMTRYTALTQKLAALESPAPSATEETTEKTDKVISDWAWIDEEEYLDEETGGLALPGASEEMPAYFVDVVTFLPYEITATVDGVEETLTIDWVCDNYPEDGAYEGEYTFTATLPEGYALDEGVKALTVPVLLGGISLYSTKSNIPYMRWNGTQLVEDTCSSATEVTDSTEDVTWSAGWYVVNQDVTFGTIMEPVTVRADGDIHLILGDGKTCTIYGRIEVNSSGGESDSLTIYGQSGQSGTLKVENVYHNACSNLGPEDGCDGTKGYLYFNAAIGGMCTNQDFDSLTGCDTKITINGGVVSASYHQYSHLDNESQTAKSGQGAAIGSGPSGKATITINAGDVTGTSDAGAGIGSGNSGESIVVINGGTVRGYSTLGAGIGSGTGGNGNVTINGGTVYGQSQSGAGIGSGQYGRAVVLINDGNVTGKGTRYGAGIGSGNNCKVAGSTVTIKGGEVHSSGSEGAGIGSGKGAKEATVVNIEDGYVESYASKGGAGIGSGNECSQTTTINITGGTVNIPYRSLSGVECGAGIGGGRSSSVGNTIIDGGNVTAHGSLYGPGIGCGPVTIKSGTVKAYGAKYAAGIGSGFDQASHDITIEGGDVTATGGESGAGIGTGHYHDFSASAMGKITITGGTVNAHGSDGGAGIGGGARVQVDGSKIEISGGTVYACRGRLLSNENDFYQSYDIGDGEIPTDKNVGQSYCKFNLPANGTAWVYLESDNNRKLITTTSGVILEKKQSDGGYETCTVYGAQSLSADYPIASGRSMTVTSGATLNTGNYGIYVQNGGTLTRNGTVNGNVYYPLTLTGCNATNTTPYQSSLFGKEGANISLTPTLPSGYKLVSWEVTPSSVSVSDYSFKMPNEATTVKANVVQAVRIDQQPTADQTITYGADVTLNVGAKNPSGTTAGITYQWYQVTDNNVKLPGKTSDSLTLTKPDAGSYSFYCEVTCDGVSINSNTATVTVNKAKASVNITGNPGKTYDGKPVDTPNYTVSGSGNPIVEYKLKDAGDSTYTKTPPMDAGEYTIRVTMLETQNYKGASDTEDFTISQATDNAWLTAPTVTNFTYGDTVNPVTYQAKYGNDKVKITYKKQGTEGTSSTTVPTDAGTYDVTVSLAGTASYPGLPDENLTLTIEKAASSVTTSPTDAQSLYTGSAVLLVTAGTPAGGTMQYSLDGQNWSNDIPKATDWKTYTVYYKVAGDNNHNDTTAQTLTAEIVPFEIQTQPQPVTIDYGNDAEMSITLDTILSDITYQWYQLTDEGDVELTDATESTLTLTKPIAGEYTYVCKITCGEYSATSAEAVVTVNAVSQPLPTTDLPDGLWAEGGEEPLNGDSIDLKSPSSRLLTKYTEGKNTQGDPYPAGMQIYSVEKDDQGQTVVVPVAELDNLLQYSGCSIRINGKPGIRMITSLTKQAKAALKKGELAGYTLEEYGTVVAWSKELGNNPLTLSTGSSNYAYRKGVSDPVFANVGNLTQYTNVLVWDSLPDEKYAKDIAMRPYIILSKDGETVTLYGGTVIRSIGYVAQQNADTFPKGSAGYKYVHDIIDRVNKLTNNSQQS